MKFLFLYLFAFLPVMAAAQGMKPQGSSISELVPQGWTHQEATGDLNKDGIPDLVISATPDSTEHITVRDDGYEYNFNKPVLAIYFGTANGDYSLYKAYENTIPGRQSEFEMIDGSYEITDRGVLRIGLSYFYSAGSYSNNWSTYVFRYQDGDFFLIGMESGEQSRTTGEAVTTSYNYLTHKKQIKTENVFEGNDTSSEKWEKIPKEPLRRLGTFELD